MTTDAPGHVPLCSAVERAGSAFARLVRITPTAAWRRPTPCPAWDVGELVAHVVGVVEGLVPMAQGNGPPPPIRSDALFGPRHTAERLLIAIRRGLTAWSGQDLVRELSWDGSPARDHLELTLVELVGHGWDLAQATGRACRVSDDVVALAAAVAVEHLGGAARRPHFADQVMAPEGSAALDRFAGLLGRVVPVPGDGGARMEPSAHPDVDR